MPPPNKDAGSPARNDRSEFRQALLQNKERVTAAIPFIREIGFQILDADDTTLFGVLPYREHLVGDPETGVVAGGVITTMLDSMCGLSCALRLKSVLQVATLDLRIDYMRPAKPHVDILAEAECYHTTRSVCFTRAIAYQGERTRIVASAAGAFAITGDAARRDLAAGGGAR
ncbi:MAG: hotdog fold thioesterase [Alphaproteobacteria bacterium]|nr:hotdog fold thioesterase [Alphaproteobacteria bacterium]